MKCNTCGKMNCMAHGGSVDEGPSEKANQAGVHKIVPNFDRKHNEVKHGHSEGRYGGTEEHRRVLSELKSLPKPKLKGLAKGGSVHDEDYERGINRNVGNSDMKMSDAGFDYRVSKVTHSDKQRSDRIAKAKAHHGETLKEMKAMPNPKIKGLAHGGEVDDDKMDMYAMSPDVPAMHGMAEGGEVDEMDGIDKELNEMAAGELMEALEKKDKAGILESIKAIVMNCGGKV